MTRILADLPDEDIRWLDARAAELGKSRASVLREAVSAYRAEGSQDWIDRGFGLWKDRTDIGDAVEWQRRERAATARPWDYDYEEVRAEFPDLFDKVDDREHEHYRKVMGADSFSPRVPKPDVPQSDAGAKPAS
ncbi:ribbon-helix-helix protein, CopG family [Novosphingobium sp. AP12]|uniref:ribbon-helix-helix protein, CopG family n=1 Tax=Novosphingobium sp. AP12 TaxID=1144305 RepID=UPI0002721F12|nr:ribbon-helix-helix protein, CopG family [Novosphingobium sp. AP12]EJL24759.1 Ribbon-helix-helix protein, copG family [Novosphingobium sp. AP12]